ncbi:hypothetical protein HETIRDRAFT_384030 [Heterobasidion irregulare TC 32-1]|uniref:G-patch domain-containing protein n=1 Tax=Heterobasidion irregulare (strain TC 32-1) TaxID=747525 RepID=W4K7D1_HETIT|nr:uncharacterized protein HETIRDRAFT_384030 [Heterobasidion irregulare TC 32-1]ETW81669.1 hypothetical protein HETIRDRAFT_384030 [Heterobasidion irregulare TC 32-1]
MPLDGHSYLVAQGWSGTGTGLRRGAISRPLAIPQKKNLAGLGKDRDEAFPFWDHLFAAAATAIKVKISSDDEDMEEEGTRTFELKRTTTGILSNRRPLIGTPASSGTATPSSDSTSTSRLSLMALAKKEAARRGLYSRFFKGPVIGPDDVETEMIKTETVVVRQIERPVGATAGDKGKQAEKEYTGSEGERTAGRPEKKKKRKVKEVEQEESEDEAERSEKKRRRREAKQAEKLERKMMRMDKRKAKEEARCEQHVEEEMAGADGIQEEMRQTKKEKRKKRAPEEEENIPEERRHQKVENRELMVEEDQPAYQSTKGQTRRKDEGVAKDIDATSKKKRKRDKASRT